MVKTNKDNCKESEEYDNIDEILGLGSLSVYRPQASKNQHLEKDDYFMREINSFNQNQYEKNNKPLIVKNELNNKKPEVAKDTTPKKRDPVVEMSTSDNFVELGNVKKVETSNGIFQVKRPEVDIFSLPPIRGYPNFYNSESKNKDQFGTTFNLSSSNSNLRNNMQTFSRGDSSHNSNINSSSTLINSKENHPTPRREVIISPAFGAIGNYKYPQENLNIKKDNSNVNKRVLINSSEKESINPTFPFSVFSRKRGDNFDNGIVSNNSNNELYYQPKTQRIYRKSDDVLPDLPNFTNLNSPESSSFLHNNKRQKWQNENSLKDQLLQNKIQEEKEIQAALKKESEKEREQMKREKEKERIEKEKQRRKEKIEEDIKKAKKENEENQREMKIRARQKELIEAMNKKEKELKEKQEKEMKELKEVKELKEKELKEFKEIREREIKEIKDIREKEARIARFSLEKAQREKVIMDHEQMLIKKEKEHMKNMQHQKEKQDQELKHNLEKLFKSNNLDNKNLNNDKNDKDKDDVEEVKNTLLNLLPLSKTKNKEKEKVESPLETLSSAEFNLENDELIPEDMNEIVESTKHLKRKKLKNQHNKDNHKNDISSISLKSPEDIQQKNFDSPLIDNFPELTQIKPSIVKNSHINI